MAFAGGEWGAAPHTCRGHVIQDYGRGAQPAHATRAPGSSMRAARWYATSVKNALARARELADRSQGIPSPLAVDIAVNFGKSKRGAAPVQR